MPAAAKFVRTMVVTTACAMLPTVVDVPTVEKTWPLFPSAKPGVTPIPKVPLARRAAVSQTPVPIGTCEGPRDFDRRSERCKRGADEVGIDGLARVVGRTLVNVPTP